MASILNLSRHVYKNNRRFIMTQKSAIKGNVFLKRAIAFICALFTISSLFLYLNINPFNTNAKDYIEYSFTVDGKTADGKTVVYYKSDKNIASYEKTGSFVNVSYCGYNSYSISVKSNVNGKAYNTKCHRTGWVTFKDSSGKVIDTCCIEQDHPYIQLRGYELKGKPIMDYIHGAKGSFSKCTLSYNCPFRITTDTSLYKHEFVNRTGGKVYEGGSYATPNGSRTVILYVVLTKDYYDNNGGGSFNIIASKKGSSTVVASLKCYQCGLKKENVTYECNKNKTTYTLTGEMLRDGRVSLKISGSNFPLLTSAKCDTYNFYFKKNADGSLHADKITTSFNKELMDEDDEEEEEN